MEVTHLLKRWMACGLALCLAAVMAGCAPLALQNVNDLLRAPELGQGQGEIQKALASYLGEQPEYKYPKEGDWRSPLIVEDLDGDGNTEGILLYSLAGSTTAGRGSNVYVAVLEQQNGAWTVTHDMEGSGTEVASFEVADLLGSGKKQLIVGYATSANLSNKYFSLYEYQSHQLVELLYPTPYSRYELADFSGNGSTELVIVSPDDQLGGLKLQYIPTVSGSLNLGLAPVKLDANFFSCSGIYPSNSADGARLLVVDGLTDTKILTSDILYFSGEHFYKVDDSGALVGETARQNPLLRARDIDGDGIVEIPQRVGMTEIVTLAGDKHLEYIQWMDFTSAEPQVKQFGIVDSGKGSYIRLPEIWMDRVRVSDGRVAGEWGIQEESSRRQLLSLKVYEGGETPPLDALLVSRASGAYLLPSSALTAGERNVIAVTSLT